MHWIVQEDTYKESGWVDLIDFLEKMELPHTIVKVVPFC